MKFSTKGTYGLRAVVELAKHYGEGPVSLRALEGSTDVVDCVGTEGNVCENACTCSARPLFLKLQSRINAVLDETTVGELTEDHIEQKKRIEHARLS